MSNNLNLSGKFENKKGQGIEVNLQIVQFNDNGVEVLFAPALEVYGYGNDFKEAVKSLSICLDEYLNYTHQKGTFEEDLKRLGWKIKGSKNNRKYKTPMFSEMLTNNERLIDIINNKQIQTYSTNLAMA